jgi:hypothetical protein
VEALTILKRRVATVSSLVLILSGFGFVGQSQAAIGSHTLTIDNASDSIILGESATAVLSHSFVPLAASDRVQLQAVVTSANASTAGRIYLSVTDSFTSSANDATPANSPRYSFGGETFNTIGSLTAATGGTTDSISVGLSVGGRSIYSAQDSITLGFSQSATSALVTSPVPAFGTSVIDDVIAKIRDRSQNFLSTNYGDARESITIAAGATDSNTVGVANRNYGSTLRLELYNPTAAGTYTISVFSRTSDNGASLVSATPTVTWTVTVTAPSRTATAASTSTLRGYVAAQASGDAAPFGGTAEATDSSVIAAATSTSTTPQAAIFVLQKNGTTTNTALESMTVSVSGPAYVSTSASTRPTSGTAITVQDDVVDASEAIFVWSTGSAGVATITVSTVSGLVIDTHSVTFFGDAATISVADVTKKVLRAGGFSNSGAFTIAVKDASGNTVTNESVDFTSSDNTIVTAGSCAAYSSAAGGYVCAPSTTVGSTSGQSVTLTARVGDPATTVTTDYITVAVGTFTLGGAISTVTLTTDKATYSPGEAMVVTATAVDASGNPTYDGQAGPTWIASTKALGGTLTMNAYYDGKSTSGVRSGLDVRVIRNTNTVFAPNASGVFTLQGVYGTDNAKSASVSATVGDDAATAAANAASDAAAEAIDAANAATDAANLAAEAADAATVAAEEARDAADAATAAVEALAKEFESLVASVKAQITTLANTVAKIAKKVKA